MAAASEVKVNLGEEHQVIRGFGGMVHNQWQGGGGLSEADAKLAFGTGDGQIGLNTLRIPVYASSNDFSKEVNAAKYAKAVAGDDFILYATPWTSEYAGGNQHVAASNYQKYVDHLNDFTAYMKNQGVPLYAISISNEPDWCSEWACWSADEIYNFTKNYADQMRKNGTKVISTESFRYDKNLYNKVLNDASALKNWDILGAHFYASDAGTANSFFEYSLADQKGVERWMTEHYTESQGSGNYWRTVMRTGDQANQNKLDTVRAMDVGYEIHRGLVNGNFNQYTWWYIRRCYGLIMEKDFGNKLSIPNDEIGKVSKRGYVLSQFARFIRPGAVRVGATANPEANLFASAYKSADGDSTIVVLVNRDYKASKSVTVKVNGAKIESFHMYTTSEAKNAKYEGEVEVVNGEATITMESGATNKDCIVTLVGVGPQVVVPREPYGGKAAVLPGKIEAENFDIMGSGKGNTTYKDDDSENKGDAEFRADEGVDVVLGGTGKAIGYTNAGEWLEYSVTVAADGVYPIKASASTGAESAGFKIMVDGVDVGNEITVAKTGEDWSTYKEFDGGTVSLAAGEHIVRLVITGTNVNVDWIMIGEGSAVVDAPTDSSVSPLPSNNFGNDVPGNVVEDPLMVKPLQISENQETSFGVYDLKGAFVGNVEACSIKDVQQKAAKIVRKGGVYYAKSAANGLTYRFSVTK